MEEYRKVLARFVKRKTGCSERPDWYPHFSENNRIEVYNNSFNFSNLTNCPLYFPHPVKSNTGSVCRSASGPYLGTGGNKCQGLSSLIHAPGGQLSPMG